VNLGASVASPNVVQSPLTGLRAAALEWRFFVRFIRHSYDEHPDHPPAMRVFGHLFGLQYPQEGEEAHRSVGSQRLGDDLLLESRGRMIQVSLRGAELRFPFAEKGGTLVERELPPAFAHFLDHPALSQGPLVYQELALSHGDRVTLVATVEPLAKDRGGAYRSGGGTELGARPPQGQRAEFFANAGQGRLVIEDRTADSVRF
jgi:hypothetical protein